MLGVLGENLVRWMEFADLEHNCGPNRGGCMTYSYNLKLFSTYFNCLRGKKGHTTPRIIDLKMI